MAWVRGGWRETRARAGEEWNQDSIQRRKEIRKCGLEAREEVSIP